MRVLLQNSITQLYYAGPGRWSEHMIEALDFGQVERAAEIYALEDLAYARIVLDADLPAELPRFSIPVLKAA